MNPEKKTRKPKKDPFITWPKRILALLVVGFCLFVGIDNVHLFTDSLTLWQPGVLNTYGLVHSTMDNAYAKNMFTDRQTPTADEPAADGGVTADDGATDGPQTEQDSGGKSVNGLLKDAFLGINGLATDALGQRELNGVVKLDNGYITRYLPEMLDLSHQVSQTVAFNQRVAQAGSKLVFVMAPHMIDKTDPQLPAGVVDYNNQMADDFLAAIGEAGVATIDIRELMREEGFNHYEGFFRTDHHWTPQTAAWATDRVMRELDEWGWADVPGGEIDVDLDDFGVVNEGVRFYGTSAERTGAAFAGEPPDTLYDVVPNEELMLRVKQHDGGDYSEPVPFEQLYRDWQYAEYDRVLGPDAYYLYKTTYDLYVMNEAAPIDNDMVFICDSFGVSFQSFATNYVNELYCFQGREHPDMTSSIQRSEIVMVLFNPDSLDIRTENANIFNF